jgi:hypothetical protein
MKRSSFVSRWPVALGILGGAVGACSGTAEPDADAVSQQLQAEITALRRSDPDSCDRVDSLRPVLKCVERIADHRYLAHFGYSNYSSKFVPNPTGGHNRFAPSPNDRDQPTRFAPGFQDDVVQVPFTGTLAWLLGNSFEIATKYSRACSPAGGPDGGVDGQSTGDTGTGGQGTGGQGTGGAGTGGQGMGGVGSGGQGTGGQGTGGQGTGGQGTGGQVTCIPGTGGQGTGGQGTGGQGTGGQGTGGQGTGGQGTGGQGTGGQGTGGQGTGGQGTGGQGTGGQGTGGQGTGGQGTGGQGTGGQGTGGQGGAVCTSPSSHCVSAACEQCTTANCFPATDGCDLIADPADKQLCENLYACVVAPTHAGSVIPGPCTAGGDPTRCWCGTNPTTCLTDPAAANGPCRDAVVAAAKSSDPGTIKLRFVDPGFPIGRAVNLSSCRGSFCGTPPDSGNGECPVP